jgi:hypothetical protein
VLLEKQQKLEVNRMEMEEKRMQRERFRELEGMIQDLCNKLRENNSKMIKERRGETSGMGERNG